MSEELQNVLAEILKQLQNGVAFAIDQAPLIIQQFLFVEFLFHAIWFGLGVLLFVIGCLVYRHASKTNESSSYHDREEAFLAFLLASLLGSISFVVVIANLYWMFVIKYAPEYYLIQTVLK
jgi:hypothetical protein